MFELYLDTVDLAQITRFNAALPLKGVTTNPTILATAKLGLKQLLPDLTDILGLGARIHVQVVSQSVNAMIAEARELNALPYDLVVKVPATEMGLAVIKQLKTEQISVLATAIYSAEQGFLAAIAGADYLAPYVNRIDSLGFDGVGVVADIQQLLDRHQLASKLLPASFKTVRQVQEILKLGVSAITLPVSVTEQLFLHPAVEPAVTQFNDDWQAQFGSKLSYET